MARPKKFDPDVAVGDALGVFWAKGYAASTPQELGERMGIGRGSLYNAFESKHALFERTLERYYEDSAELLEILKAKGPAKKRIRKLLRTILSLDAADPERRGCYAVNVAVELATHDERVKSLVEALFGRTESSLKAVIEEGQQTGEIDGDQDAAALAAFLLNSMIGMRVLGKTAKDKVRLERVVDVVMKAL